MILWKLGCIMDQYTWNWNCPSTLSESLPCQILRKSLQQFMSWCEVTDRYGVHAESSFLHCKERQKKENVFRRSFFVLRYTVLLPFHKSVTCGIVTGSNDGSHIYLRNTSLGLSNKCCMPLTPLRKKKWDNWASSTFGVTKATLRAYVKTNSFCKVRGIRQLKIMSKLELEQEIVVTKLLASTLSGPAWNEVRKLTLELAERNGILL
jgi:hypothetical protein